MKIGILREEKIPHDKRVAFNPEQCTRIMQLYPEVEIRVQSSPHRAFKDDEYSEAGIAVVDQVQDCDVLIGVKEVPKELLLERKTYLYFSHTHKRQPYNRFLLKAMIEKCIRMVDYEVITDIQGKRLIGFGRYAGIVGTYNAFRGWGIKSGSYELKPAHQCFDRKELESELSKVTLPANFTICITGGGRVGGGTLEILHHMGIRQVFPTEFLEKDFDEPVFTQLQVEDYNEPLDGSPFIRTKFYKDPTPYRSTFMRFARKTDLYIPCHFWDQRSPYIFTREDAKQPDFRIKMVADISCDVDCAVASTLRSSTIDHPFYGYHPEQEREVDVMHPESIAVMAVDNLPCELPRDASSDFGDELIKNVIPYLVGEDPDNIIARATLTENCGLSEYFSHLADWVKD